ncbi:hypothetical protein [Bradyrhizobium sp. WD16]|uniref:hypothetical protein n=1 Tax=Bradyrhizobium sp. WD16 TaxID=1521768 RepID=UPI0020A4C2CC|nr:hypothetical protein [Bradyrhizobium sp. WD16]
MLESDHQADTADRRHHLGSKKAPERSGASAFWDLICAARSPPRNASQEASAAERIICIAEKCPRAAVAALGDVMRNAGNDDAGETGHS